MRLRRVVFFEDRSKYGHRVHLHAHALISVPKNYERRFNQYFPKMWAKIFPSSKKSQAFEMAVFDQDQLVPYVSKYSNTDYEFIADL